MEGEGAKGGGGGEVEEADGGVGRCGEDLSAGTGRELGGVYGSGRRKGSAGSAEPSESERD